MTPRIRKLTAIFVFMALIVPLDVFGQENEEEEEESPWAAEVGIRYLSKFTNYGVDLGQDRAAMPIGCGITHLSGLGLSAEVVNVLGSSGGIQQSSLSLEYDRPLSELLSVSFELSHYFYKSDTLNALSGLSNSLSVNADLDFGSLSLSVFYDLYLGGAGASFFGASVTGFYSVQELVVVPLLHLGFVSQEVQGAFLKSNRGKSKALIGSTAQSVTGLSNVSLLVVLLYPFGEGFSASLTPSLLYSPSELSTHTSQFVWSAGIKYSREF